MIRLKYSLGKTIKLSNGNWTRVDVGAEFDCEADKAEVEKIYARMKKFVDGKVEKGVNEWMI